METTKIGWIGLGHMGTPMSLNLLNAGLDVSVYNRSVDKTQVFAERGARIARSIGGLCNFCDIIFVMVSDDVAAKNIFSEALEADVSGKLFVNMSTVSPDTSKLISEQCKNKQAKFLEAPVSGSVKPATEGTLIILAAGESEDYDTAIPFFERLGKLSLYLGDIGQGSIAKLAVNYYLAVTIQGIAETTQFAKSHGMSPEVMMLILNESACGSPMSRMKTPSVINGTYPAAFPLKHMAKDVKLVCEQGLDYPMSKPVFDIFQQALHDNLGDEDVMAVVKALRK